ncbi:MAG TPA: hypothetical protein VEV65_10195 [Kineosporiaceae bacterium]|nr:hypothetical protein [Kineosporiaceae bacterium]
MSPASRRTTGRVPRPLRRRSRALGLLGVVAALLAVVATPVAAFASTSAPPATSAAPAAPAAPFGSCTNPPEAAAADEVVGGVLDPASANLPAPLNPGATSTARKATTQLDLWGWTGFAWPDYDPGSSFGSCTLGQAGHIEDTVVGFVARAQLETLVWASAATTGVARAAYDPHKYDVLSGLEGTIRDGLGDGIAKVLFPLLAACVGGWLVVTADRRSPRQQARSAGGVILLGISVVLVAVWTMTLGPRLDEQITKTVTWIDATINRTPTDSDPGREIGESLRTNLLEPTWRFGMFGTVDGATAKSYGPQLLHSAAISNQERADLQADPKLKDDQQKISSALSDLADAKAQAYDKFAAKLKDSDPRAYLVLAGSHNDRRLWAATTGWIVYWGVGAIQWLASVLSIWCLVIVRLIVQAWPAVALLGLFRPRAAVRVLGIALGAAIADVGVSAVAAVERVAMRAILSWQADGGGIAAIVLAVVVAAISLWACWPFVRCVPGVPRRIKQLGTPFTGGRSRRALPSGEERPELTTAPVSRTPGEGDLVLVDALPAEAAPGREVVPVARPRAPVESPPPRAAPPAPARASAAEPSQEAPWTSVPFAEPSSVGSRPSAPGSRGLPAAPERSLESA